MDNKCAYCLKMFWKPTYDASDAQKCRRCTMFMNVMYLWSKRASNLIPEPKVLAYDW